MVYYSLIIFLAAYLNIWEDEVYSMNTSSKSLGYAFKQAYEFELQPPVYFLLLTIWRTISDSVIWARLLSVSAIFLSQLLLYSFIKEKTDRKTATFFSVLFLLNPLIIYAALEIRTFAFVLFFSVIILISFYNSYYHNKIAIQSRILFVALATAGLFTQYFIGFLLFANAVVLLAEKKWKSLGIYLLDMIIPLALLLLSMPKVLSCAGVQAASFPEYIRTIKDFFVEIKGMAGQLTFSFFLPTDFVDSKILQTIFKATILILFFISLDYSRIREALRHSSSFVIVSLVIFSFFTIVLWRYGKYSVEKKYLMVLFPSLFLLIVTFFRYFKPGIQYLWFFIFMITYLVNVFNKYHDPYKVKDFRSLASFLEESEKKGEPVFVFRNISAENLKYYYTGLNELIPLPDEFSYHEKFGQNQWTINEQNIVELKTQMQNFSEFYLVIDNSPLRGVKESQTVLLDFLFSNYGNMLEKPFNGKIILYKFSNSELNRARL